MESNWGAQKVLRPGDGDGPESRGDSDRNGQGKQPRFGEDLAEKGKASRGLGRSYGGRERSLREGSGRGGPGPGLGDKGTSGLQKPQALQLDSL